MSKHVLWARINSWPMIHTVAILDIKYEGLSPTLPLDPILCYISSSSQNMNSMVTYNTQTYGTGAVYDAQQLWQCALYWSGSTTNAYGLSTNSISPIFKSLFVITCLPCSSVYLSEQALINQQISHTLCKLVIYPIRL
jgi:hypothetical protein